MSFLFGAGVGGSAIPDSVVAQYNYEDESNTSTATDSVGSNDMTISGSNISFDSTTVKCGSNSLANDGSDPATESNNSVDLASNGTNDELSIAGFVYPNNTNGQQFLFGWANNNNNFLYANINETGNGNFSSYLQIGGTNYILDSGVSPSNSWTHIAVTVNASDVMLYLDGTQEASTTHNDTPSNMGIGEYVLGERRDQNRRFFDGNWDNTIFADAELSASEIQDLIDECS